MQTKSRLVSHPYKSDHLPFPCASSVNTRSDRYARAYVSHIQAGSILDKVSVHGSRKMQTAITGFQIFEFLLSAAFQTWCFPDFKSHQHIQLPPHTVWNPGTAGCSRLSWCQDASIYHDSTQRSIPSACWSDSNTTFCWNPTELNFVFWNWERLRGSW